MSRQYSGGEGVYVAVGLLIVIVCVAGSVATHQDVMDIFFLGLFIVLNLLVLAAIIIGMISVFVYVFKRDKGDERSFLQIFKQEYSNNRVVENYRLLFHHIGEHLGETETYVKLMNRLSEYENSIGKILSFKAKSKKKTMSSSRTFDDREPPEQA